MITIDQGKIDRAGFPAHPGVVDSFPALLGDRDGAG